LITWRKIGKNLKKIMWWTPYFCRLKTGLTSLWVSRHVLQKTCSHLLIITGFSTSSLHIEHAQCRRPYSPVIKYISIPISEIKKNSKNVFIELFLYFSSIFCGNFFSKTKKSELDYMLQLGRYLELDEKIIGHNFISGPKSWFRIQCMTPNCNTFFWKSVTFWESVTLWENVLFLDLFGSPKVWDHFVFCINYFYIM